MDDEKFMLRAIKRALQAEKAGNLPVGALITLNNEIIAEGENMIWTPTQDGTRHAEMQAIRAVPKRLWVSAAEMSIYTTLEPCLMCFGSILLHKIGRVVFGVADDYGGASPVLPYLPPFFKEQAGKLQWLGPLMPDKCDPLRERLRSLEESRKFF